MMRKSILIFAITLLSTSLCSAMAQPGEEQESEADSSVELVEFKNENIAIKYPAGWELMPEVSKSRVMHVKTLSGKVNASVTVQEVLPGTTLDQYRDATTRDIETDAKDLSPRKLGEEKAHLGKIDAWKLIYSISVPKTEPTISAKQTLYLTVKNNRGYLLCCTAFDALPGKFDSVFRLMADTLRITENTGPAKE